MPDQPAFEWRVELPSDGLGGISANETHVMVGCRDALDQNDLFVCLSAETGEFLWQNSYAALGTLDYGNSPRATPMILEDCVVTLGAFGDLRCLDLDTGAVLWECNLQKDFGGKLPTWGFCGTPLVIEKKVILQVGADDAALVAMDLDSGAVLWKSTGRTVSYSSLVITSDRAEPQIIGFDQSSLGGWSPADGRRLWEIVAEQSNEFNVPTPIVDATGVFVATENFGARRYKFDARGLAQPTPISNFESFAPDMHTGVQVGERIFGVHGELFCLDAKSLTPIWSGTDDGFEQYVSLVASPQSLLALTIGGELILCDARGDRFRLIDRLNLTDADVEIYSHPAFVGKRMFVRLGSSLACLDLSQSSD